MTWQERGQGGRSVCQGPRCAAEILWIRTENRAMCPVHPIPVKCIADPKGPVVGYRVRAGWGVLVRGRSFEHGEPQPGQEVVAIHETHFASCPDRELFSGRARAR
mgnify:CR=1 FL=1